MNAGVLNRLVGERIIGRLAILPGTRFFVSPGARSVPLVAALAALRPDRVLTHYDERGMAFCALGHAKATGRLAVCITTSGSAVANLHPAITEAAHSNTPMLFLTADRPPELLDSGANQTIDQRGIFGPSVKWSTNLPCPAPENPPDSLVKRIDALLSEAVAKACGRPPGPVQLNCPFREPLWDADTMSGSLPDPVPPAAVRREASLPMEAAAGRFMKQNAGHPGCVIVGELTDDEQRHGESILKLAHALGWPVLADALSGLSLRDSPNVVCHAPLIVSQDNVPEPVAALRFGGPLVAKELIRFEAAIESGRRLCVHRAGRRFDPLLTRPAVLCGSPSEFCRAALPAIQRRSDAGWSEEWRVRSDSTKENVARILDGENDGDVTTEPGIARTIARLMPAEGVLFLGNSMPVRDFDRHASIPHRQKQPLIAGNRGTSGIDGNFATIAGHARGSRLPTAAILGDLAALHDLNSLPLLVAAAGELPFLPIVVVIVNNGGGGIFRMLPALDGIPERQRLIETPHALRLGSAAAMFGIRHATPDTLKAFGDTFLAAIERPGVTLIEIISDIEANARLQARLSGHS